MRLPAILFSCWEILRLEKLPPGLVQDDVHARDRHDVLIVELANEVGHVVDGVLLGTTNQHHVDGRRLARLEDLADPARPGPLDDLGDDIRAQIDDHPALQQAAAEPVPVFQGRVHVVRLLGDRQLGADTELGDALRIHLADLGAAGIVHEVGRGDGVVRTGPLQPEIGELGQRGFSLPTGMRRTQDRSH